MAETRVRPAPFINIPLCSEPAYELNGGEELTCRDIIKGVGPFLNPNAELEDLAAAEGAVHAKDSERASEVAAMQDELKRGSRGASLRFHCSRRLPVLERLKCARNAHDQT